MFMLACARGRLEDVEKMWEHFDIKNEVNKPGGWNKVTPLMLAAQANQIEVVNFLLGHNADASVQNSLGSNALMLAAEEGYKEIVRVLHEHDNKLMDQKTTYGQTALMLCIESSEEVAWYRIDI